MNSPRNIVSRVFINLDGREVQRPIMQKLVELVVDQHSHLPDMFAIRFRDPGLELLDGGPFDLAQEVEIRAARQDGEQVTLIVQLLENLLNHFVSWRFLLAPVSSSHVIETIKYPVYVNRIIRRWKSRFFSFRGDVGVNNDIQVFFKKVRTKDGKALGTQAKQTRD